MARPLALCLEDLAPPPGAPRFVRCVALVGREAGLRLDERGALGFGPRAAGGTALCVSQDDRLILLRLADAPAVTVHRGGRSLAAPVEQPVLLRHQDELAVGGRRLRVHVHGATDEALAPAPVIERQHGGLVRAAAAALLLGGAFGGSCIHAVPAPPPGTGPGAASPPPTAPAPASAPADGGVPPSEPPIEIRHAPPVPPPPPGACGARRGRES